MIDSTEDYHQARKEAAHALIKHPVPKEGDLSIWWIPQVPGKLFRWPVRSPQEGKAVLDCLAQYDLFQLANGIKPDYANIGGLSVWTEGEWLDWEDENGNNIDGTEL